MQTTRTTCLSSISTFTLTPPTVYSAAWQRLRRPDTSSHLKGERKDSSHQKHRMTIRCREKCENVMIPHQQLTCWSSFWYSEVFGRRIDLDLRPSKTKAIIWNQDRKSMNGLLPCSFSSIHVLRKLLKIHFKSICKDNNKTMHNLSLEIHTVKEANSEFQFLSLDLCSQI